MDFTLTTEQAELSEVVSKFARSELASITEDEGCTSFDHRAWRRCADLGLHGMPLAEEYGGSGADLLSSVIAIEALAYGASNSGLVFSLNAQLWAVTLPLAHFGDETQKRHYLPRLCDGSIIGAHAMTEPEAGSDAFATATTARRDGETYVLTGAKRFITNAPMADVFLVFATTDASHRLGSLCAFLIDRDTPGLTVGRQMPKVGLVGAPMSEVYLDHCQVSARQMLGRVGSGMRIFQWAMERERACIPALSVGIMRRTVEECVSYVGERRQSDVPISAHQAVSHRIADMKMRLDSSRLLLYSAASSLDKNESAEMRASLAKLYITESFVASALDAIQVHGGSGISSEFPWGRVLGDAVASRVHSGTSEIQRNIIARLLQT